MWFNFRQKLFPTHLVLVSPLNKTVETPAEAFIYAAFSHVSGIDATQKIRRN